MKQTPAMHSLGAARAQFLTPQGWKQAHQAWRRVRGPCASAGGTEKTW
jgi:hypothetical protein